MRRTKNILNEEKAARALTLARASAPIAGRIWNSEETQISEKVKRGTLREHADYGE
jgi:hypothetical protein